MANFGVKFRKITSLILSLSILLSQTVGALDCLPNVAVQESGGSSSSTVHVPAILRADDLFIRCDNAVFSGSRIHSRLLEAIVTGDLTIESLADEFRSESHSTDIGVNLAGITSLIQEVNSGGSALSGAASRCPTMRFANEEDISRKVHETARLV